MNKQRNMKIKTKGEENVKVKCKNERKRLRDG